MAHSIMDACNGCTACARSCPVAAIRGERGSRHAIEDRACIDCGACGRICPQGAVRDDQGRQVPRLSRDQWKKPAFDLSRCISCACCEAKCPVSCISMGEGRPGGLAAYPTLAEARKCVSCGFCAFYCPMSCITIVSPAASPGGGNVDPAARGARAI